MPSKHARKAWVKVETRLVHEELTRDQVTTLVFLLCHMNDRWARDGKSPEEACHTVLDKPTMMRISGKHRADIALKSLRCLADVVSMSVELRGDFVLIHWPKFAETQNLGGLCSPSNVAQTGENADADADADKNPLSLSGLGGILEASGQGNQIPDWVSVPLLLQSIAELPGTPEVKNSWLVENLGLMGLEVLKDPNIKKTANRAAALAALAFRYYRAHCEKPKRPKGKGKTTTSDAPLKSGYESATERSIREHSEWLQDLKDKGAAEVAAQAKAEGAT